MKRYLYILIGIIVIAAVAILLLFVWRNAHSGASTATTNGATGSLPITGTQSAPSSGNTSGTGTALGTPSSASSTTSESATSFGIVDNDPTINYFVDAQNNIFGIKTDGTIEEITNGQSSELSSSTIDEIISANFSYDGKKVLVLYGNQNDPQAAVFDIASGTWTALPSGLLEAQWSPNSYEVAYLSPGKTGTVLATFNVASPAKAPVALTNVNAQDLTIQWLTPTQILLADKPSAEVGTSLLLWNTKTQTLSPVIFEQDSLETIWVGSTSSTQPLGLVFTGSDGSGYALQLDTLAGSALQTLSFMTLPSKCLFNVEGGGAATSTSSSPILYCGIPRDQTTFESAHLPDDYDQMALFTSDDIYKINILTGATDVLWSDQTQNIDTSDLKFFNGNLFFINRYDQKVYALTLPAGS